MSPDNTTLTECMGYRGAEKKDQLERRVIYEREIDRQIDLLQLIGNLKIEVL